jgi:AcrR family transcriptional regulator
MNEPFSHITGVARPRPPGRLEAIAQAALELFSTRGYRRTQVADVAQQLGVSPGSLYAYVASKEALLELAVLRAFGERPRSAALPLRTPSPRALVRQVRARLGRRIAEARLGERAGRPAPPDVAAELRGVLGDLYDGMAENAAAIRLLERTAPDRPELADLYFGRLRSALIEDMGAYLARRIAEGRLAPVPDAVIAARLVIETTAWFAWHRLGDPFPQPMDDGLARATVIEVLARGLLPGGTSP